ncbi:hypothetical protein HII31_13734 [Pseudocercospora fuligena]|uniref:Uncharacterized protein n=1 Tax=Pseudocercospora fuligena TaxID=685502 RepID=A0A8H6R6U8_9PEZI|nr:hypothetical protein HII31_13734 [Pseudocercospora fuligena]
MNTGYHGSYTTSVFQACRAYGHHYLLLAHILVVYLLNLLSEYYAHILSTRTSVKMRLAEHSLKWMPPPVPTPSVYPILPRRPATNYGSSKPSAIACSTSCRRTSSRRALVSREYPSCSKFRALHLVYATTQSIELLPSRIVTCITGPDATRRMRSPASTMVWNRRECVAFDPELCAAGLLAVLSRRAITLGSFSLWSPLEERGSRVLAGDKQLERGLRQGLELNLMSTLTAHLQKRRATKKRRAGCIIAVGKS